MYAQRDERQSLRWMKDSIVSVWVYHAKVASLPLPRVNIHCSQMAVSKQTKLFISLKKPQAYLCFGNAQDGRVFIRTAVEYSLNITNQAAIHRSSSSATS